ncbi:MAG: trypsin-like peptidase domain-containing protein [Deltaproteobacteria bacterium]|nr:trypsin-like peptidase domain-containing protein [Deltaproteobacteria bacterium]
MRKRTGSVQGALVVLVFAAAAGVVLAAQPNPTNRIHMTSKPAIVKVASGWIAQWSWEGQTLRRGMVGSGTGFFIHPDGYILTNAHVADTSKMTEDEVKLEAYKDILAAWLEANNFDVSESNLEVLHGRIQSGQMVGPELLDFMRISLVFLQSGEKLTFEIKAFGAPMGEGSEVLTGKDVAVLKVETKNAPTLKLGDSSAVEVGDHVWVMGYPAAADTDETGWLDEKSSLEPTTNDGSISAKKTSRDGTPVLQTNTATTHGNSGGPVINEKGEVIGLLTFRGDTVFGQEVQGFNFIVPINTAMEFVRQAGTENKRGPVDEKWAAGLEEYWNEYYSKAKLTFTDVMGLFPEHSEAKRLVQDCAEKIAEGKDKTPPPEAPKPPEQPATTPTAGGTTPPATLGAPTKGVSEAMTAAAEAQKKAAETQRKAAAAAEEEGGFPTWAILAIGGGGAALVLVIVLIFVLGKKKPAGAPVPGAYGPPPGAIPGAPPGASPPYGMPAPAPGMAMAGGPMAAAPPGMAMAAGAAAAAVAPHAPGGPGPAVARTELFQAPSTTARLTCTVGPFQGRDFPVGPGFFIGRDPARAQLLIQDSQVSGQHLWIGPAGGRIVARDMGSTNGTYHNNRTDQRVTEVPLAEGDVLALGQRGTVQFIFHA